MTSEALSLQTTPIVTFGYIMQVLISLLMVLALIYLSAKYLLPRLKVERTGKLIKILDRVYLEPQVSAYIIKAGKGAWLIAASNKNISRIDRIDDIIQE